jgi:hypothetical protein
MAGPWEQYQGQEKGPWSQYASVSTEPEVKPDTGFTGALKSSYETLKGEAALLAGKTGIMSLDEAEKYYAGQQEKARKAFKPTEEGWTEAPVTKFKELLGGSVPYMAAPLAAAGAAAALPVTGTVATVATLGAAGAASAAQFTGSNLSRQMDTGKSLAQTDLLEAGSAAIPQAALDTLSFKLMPGIGRIFNQAGVKITDDVARDVAKKGIAATAGEYALSGVKIAGIEGGTEAAQQFFERLQAGLNIADEEARKEYYENFIGGAVLGGTIGVGGRAYEKAFPRKAEQPDLTASTLQEKPLTTPTTLALPSPEEIILNEREYDPLKNPIGNFSSDELTPEQIKYIDNDRKANGKPKLKSYSLEDLVDAVNHSDETAAAKQGIIDNLLTVKTGYKSEVDLTPDDIYNVAQQKNVETQTQGFNDFLRRATGSEDVMNMSQPQLFSAFEALSKLEPSEELLILPEGTNAVRFSEKQYEKALAGLESVYDEFGTSSLGRTSVIQEIKDFAGLERDADAEALYRQALRRNDLEENLREVKTTEGTKTVPEVSFAGKIEPLPSGFDIRYQTFKQGVEPEAYEIKNGSVVIDRAKTKEEADKILDKQTKINEQLVKKPEADIAKLEKAIANRNAALDVQRAKGYGDTLGFRKLSAELDARNKVDQKSIEVHQADIQNFRNPLKIVPVGEKPVTKQKYVMYEGEKPVASFGEKAQAEEYGIMKLDEDMLQRIIETGPKTKGVLPKRYAAYAAKEMKRRKGELPKGIEVKKSIYTDKVDENFEKLRQQLLPALKRFGLEKVGLRVVKSIADGKADGSYIQELIKVAYDAKNPMATLRHESIHALKELGAFTPDEWKVLTNKAKSDWIKKYIKPNIMEGYRNQYIAENGNLRGFDEFIQEEAIAEAFADFANTKPPAGLIGNIFFRIGRLFEALGNTFKRLGFKTADDIFQKVERGEAKPTRAAVSEAEKFKQAEEQPEQPRKIGKRIVGAPPDVSTEQARTALVKKMTNLLEHPYAMYDESKDWYERSGDTIRQVARGDAQLMEKIVRLMSIYSQANSLGGNVTALVKSLGQLARGEPTAVAGRFPEQTSKIIPEALAAKEFDTNLKGVSDKLMNFYRNLHDGTFKQNTFEDSTTIDRWMMRLFGYPHTEDREAGGASAVSATQYKYAKDLIRRIADANEKKTGEKLAPRQIQAVLWTYVKNMSDAAKAKDEGKKFEPSAIDFSDYINRATANITWESRPSTSIDLIPGIHKASRKEQDDFNRAVRKIFENKDGSSKIFELLKEGVLYSSQNSIGAYENQIAPNVITRLVLERDGKDYVNEIADKAAAIIGYVTKQDAVPWYRADPTASGKFASKGYKVSTGETITPEFEERLFKHLDSAMPGVGFTRVDNSFDFINFRGDDGKPFFMSDKEYIKKLQSALETFAPDVDFTIDPFKTESAYIFNNWKENPDGQGYLERFSPRQLTDIRATLDDWSKAYTDLANQYGKEYGWDKREGGGEAEGGVEPTAPKEKFSLRDTVDPSIWGSVDRTTTKREQKGFIERLLTAIFPDSAADFRFKYINALEGIERQTKEKGRLFGDKELLAENSALAAALQSLRAAGVAAASFRDGIPVFRKGYTYVTDNDGKNKGLIPIFEPLAKYGDPEIYRLFQFYAGTKRGKRLMADGREKLFTPEDIAKGEALEKQFPEFKTVFDEYQTYNKGLVDFMKDTGVISDAEAKIWTQNWDYIPFYRQLDGESTAGPKVFSALSGVSKPKKLKGGQEELADFMETVVRNSRAAIEAGMKNEAARRAVRDAKALGTAEELKESETGADIVNVKENGQTKYYRVADPLLVKSMQSLNMPQLELIAFLGKPAEILRNFVTKDPGFILANLGRDSLQAWITSGTKMTPVVDTFKEFGNELFKRSPVANALARAGMTGYDFAGDVKSTSEQVMKELRKRGDARTTTEKALLPITALWDALEQGSHASDMATRIAIYKQTLERTGSEAEAMYQAMEVLNFSRRGASPTIRMLAAMIPFLNARIQGLDVLYRSGWGEMATENKDAMKKAFAVRALTMMGMSMMYWFLVSDEDEYKKLTKEERDNYWIVPGLEVGGKPFRFPIPFELGVVFKVIPERVLETAFGSDTGKDLKESMIRQLTSTLGVSPPQAFLPILENVANYSFFTGEPLVSRGLQDLEPRYQFTSGTSQMARDLGAQLNISPIKIENILRGYTGTLGTYAVQALDAIYRGEGDPVKATTRMEQLPVIKRFFASDSGTVAAYYDLKGEVDTAVRTVNLLERTGDVETLKEYLGGKGKVYLLKDYVSSLEKDMKQIREARRIINESRDRTPDEKREYLDRLHDMEVQLTENIRAMRKQYQ